MNKLNKQITIGEVSREKNVELPSFPAFAAATNRRVIKPSGSSEAMSLARQTARCLAGSPIMTTKRTEIMRQPWQPQLKIILGNLSPELKTEIDPRLEADPSRWGQVTTNLD
jgi:hypothetical protein